jgi:hypothetical protein
MPRKARIVIPGVAHHVIQRRHNPSPREPVLVLNKAFTEFDRIADRHGLQKIKTIGDACMAVAGVRIRRWK